VLSISQPGSGPLRTNAASREQSRSRPGTSVNSSAEPPMPPRTGPAASLLDCRRFDSETVQLALQRRELAATPEQEAAEPIAISAAKRLSTATASTVAAELTARDALAAYLRAGLNRDADDLATPVQAGHERAAKRSWRSRPLHRNPKDPRNELQVTEGDPMTIGVGVFLMAVGAILTFAVHVSVSGLDVAVIGVVLMIAGAGGIALHLAVFAPRRRRVPGGSVADPPVGPPDEAYEQDYTAPTRRYRWVRTTRRDEYP